MLDHGSPRVASVFGSARLLPGDHEYAEAEQLGRLLHEAGWVVCTGGYDGAMAAVSRGAREAGGHVVGITMDAWAPRLRPNSWVLEERPAADLFERVRLLTASDAWLAVAGGIGTLAEVALAWNLLQSREIEPRPLVLVGRRWRAVAGAIRRELVVGEHDLDLVLLARDPEHALALLS